MSSLLHIVYVSTDMLVEDYFLDQLRPWYMLCSPGYPRDVVSSVVKLLLIKPMSLIVIPLLVYVIRDDGVRRLVILLIFMPIQWSIVMVVSLVGTHPHAVGSMWMGVWGSRINKIRKFRRNGC